MSTACKLDRRVREARSRRATALAHVERTASDKSLRTPEALFALDVADRLRTVKNDPSRTGVSKDRAYKAILNRSTARDL